MTALGGAVVVAYWAYLYYGPGWQKYDEAWKYKLEGKMDEC